MKQTTLLTDLATEQDRLIAICENIIKNKGTFVL